MLTVDQFVALEIEKLQEFAAFWKEEMAKGELADGSDEPVFPEKMPHGTWDEQFYAFAAA